MQNYMHSALEISDLAKQTFCPQGNNQRELSKLLSLRRVMCCPECHGVEVSPPHSHHCLLIHPLSTTRRNVSFLHSCCGGKSDVSPGKLSKFTFLKKWSASVRVPPFLQRVLHWKVKVAQLCPTVCDPMDYTVHGLSKDKPKELK